MEGWLDDIREQLRRWAQGWRRKLFIAGALALTFGAGVTCGLAIAARLGAPRSQQRIG